MTNEMHGSVAAQPDTQGAHGLAALGAALREISDREPADVPELEALRQTPAQPLRLSYSIEAGAIALYARRALGGPGDEGVCAARAELPDWLLHAETEAPEQLDADARRDLAELVRASFAVYEARIAEHFEFAVGNDTVLNVVPGPTPTLSLGPATTPSPRLQPALPTHGHEYTQAGDPHQAGGGGANRGTGGTGVDGTRAPADAQVPDERAAEAPLGGGPRAIEGTLGQALVEGSPTDEDPPAASPGRLGH